MDKQDKQDKPGQETNTSGTSDSAKALSTTQLAKQLDLPLKKLFALLNESTWITRTNDQWQLTAKGEFEGGHYKTHSKYGQYIVWPTSVVNHRLFKQLIQHNEGSTHSATAIAKSLTSELNKARSDKQTDKKSETEPKQSISAKRLNTIFFELGWIEKAKGGWQPTDIGKQLGGETNSNDKTGIPYVLWPKALQHNAYLQHSIQLSFPILDTDTKNTHSCLDGHSHNHPALSQIDNWLYHAGLLHAINRPLPLQKAEGETLAADFYLPSHHIHIEYWGFENTPAYLKQKLAKQDWYKQHQLKLIELTAEDLPRLDEVLPKALLEFGVEV